MSFRSIGSARASMRCPGFQLVISYNPGYQSVLKNIKELTRQRFVAHPTHSPPADTETEAVAHEAGIDARDGARPSCSATPSRTLDLAPPLREASSTPTLIPAGGLFAEGSACAAPSSRPSSKSSPTILMSSAPSANSPSSRPPPAP